MSTRIRHPIQLPLDIQLRENASFETFLPGLNGQTLASVKGCSTADGERFLFLWGESGTGKSHLLQAACKASGDTSQAAAYVPLVQAGSFTPDLLLGLGELDLVCIDDVQCISGDRNWEKALFNLFNRLQERRAGLIASADKRLPDLKFSLADLRSRLASGPGYRLRPLNDDEKIQVLTDSARRRGLSLPPETARYILGRFNRDLVSLIELLERLDEASLAAGRRLTIPFVRTLEQGTDN